MQINKCKSIFLSITQYNRNNINNIINRTNKAYILFSVNANEFIDGMNT